LEIKRSVPRAGPVSPVLTATGMSRLELGATVPTTLIGCSLPVIEDRLSSADGIRYWRAPEGAGTSVTAQAHSLPEAIVNARMLGVHPSKAVGAPLTVTVLIPENEVAGTKSVVFRIRGVFDPGNGMPRDSVYVSLGVLRTMTGRTPGECSEIWVWFDEGKAEVSRAEDSRIILDSILRNRARAGLVSAADLVILKAGQRYPKHLAPMERALAEARDVVHALSRECAK